MDRFLRGRDAFDFHASEAAKLVPLWPNELDTSTPRKRACLIVTLRRIERGMRIRRSDVHWTYCPARHSQLIRTIETMRKAAKLCHSQTSR